MQPPSCRAASAECRHIIIFINSLKSCDYHNFPGIQLIADPLRIDSFELCLTISRCCPHRHLRNIEGFACTPRDWKAMAINATDTCSPVTSSMSSSLLDGVSVISRAFQEGRPSSFPWRTELPPRHYPSRNPQCSALHIHDPLLSATELPPNFSTSI